MISEIRIRNFQAHAKRRVRFGKVTTIVGPSDAGKSAIIRAIIWALTNKPNGDQMVRHGAKDAVVDLCWDGHIIRRSRGKAGNLYALDGEEYIAFKTGVPEQITELTGITAESPQIQQQYDQPYWLNETAGEVARRFNALIGLDVIDSSMRTLSLSIRRKETEQDILDKRLKTAVADRDAVAWAAEAAEAFKRVKALRQTHRDAEQDWEDLSHEIAAIKTAEAVVDRWEGLEEDFAPVPAAVRQWRELVGQMTALSDTITLANTLLPSLVDLPSAPEIAMVEMAHTTAARAYSAHKGLSEILETAATLTENIAANSTKIKEGEDLLALMTCPECGQALEGDHHE
jgi:DNA repair exonuclease SbcCD ATPase subunit